MDIANYILLNYSELKLLLCLLCGLVRGHACTCHITHVEVRGQLAGTGFLLLSSWVQGIKLRSPDLAASAFTPLAISSALGMSEGHVSF